MWTFVMQPGLATTIVDFTNALSPLLVGLGSVVWLHAAPQGREGFKVSGGSIQTPPVKPSQP